MDITGCLEKGYLVKIKYDNELIKKELDEAEYDLRKAENAFGDADYKWCIVKSYYSIFHSAKAVLFKLGYREKRHFAIGLVLEYLNKKGKLEMDYVNYFNAAISSREDADYHYTYSKDIAKHNLEIAYKFIKKIKYLINEVNLEELY